MNVGGGEVWNFGTYVDGTNNHSKWLTLQRAPQLGSSGFAIETVKEVQLITNQFSAEFGGHSAGVSSMITKSGTNEVTGSAFVMIRPGDWDAMPPLATRSRRRTTSSSSAAPSAARSSRTSSFYLRQLRAAARAQPGGRHLAGGVGQVVPTPADEHQGHFRGDSASRDEIARRALQHGAVEARTTRAAA